jgi:hypothetical protein
MSELDGFYENPVVRGIGFLVSFITFTAIWISAIASVGWVFGVVIGWIPAFIAGTIAFFLWPFVLLIVFFLILLAIALSA